MRAEKSTLKKSARRSAKGKEQAAPHESADSQQAVEADALDSLVEKAPADKPAESAADKPSEGEKAPAAPSKKKKKKRRASPLLRFLLKLELIAAIGALVFIFVLGIHINHGNRMHPFIMDGDLVITYKLEPYHIGDVVAYRHPVTGEVALSRIVAMDGDMVSMTEVGELFVNGLMPVEEVFYATKKLDGSSVEYPHRVGEGGYFVLDDYRTVGKDSRVFGDLTEKDLLGKVVYVLRRRGI